MLNFFFFINNHVKERINIQPKYSTQKRKPIMGAVKKRELWRAPKRVTRRNQILLFSKIFTTFSISKIGKKKLVTILNSVVDSFTTILNFVAAVFGWLLFFSPSFFSTNERIHCEEKETIKASPPPQHRRGV